MSILRSISSSLYLLAHLMHFLMLLKGTHHREIRVLNNFKAFSDYIWNARQTDRCVEFRSNASFEWFCFPQMPIIALLLGFSAPLFFGYLFSWSCRCVVTIFFKFFRYVQSTCIRKCLRIKSVFRSITDSFTRIYCSDLAKSLHSLSQLLLLLVKASTKSHHYLDTRRTK